VICRQKKYSTGGEGPLETYHREGRNFKRTPLRPGEVANTSRFQQAERLRQQEMADPERVAYWTARFKAQLKEKEPGNTKQYNQLAPFMRAMLMRQLTNNN